MTTYKRVKQILTDATKEYKANYQGYGNFWDLPSIEALEKVTIYGIQMIAPVTQSACVDMLEPKPEASSCCSPQEETPETAKKLQGLKLMIPLPPHSCWSRSRFWSYQGIKRRIPLRQNDFPRRGLYRWAFP